MTPPTEAERICAVARLRKVVDRRMLKSRLLDYRPTMVTVLIADLEILLAAAPSTQESPTNG